MITETQNGKIPGVQEWRQNWPIVECLRRSQQRPWLIMEVNKPLCALMFCFVLFSGGGGGRTEVWTLVFMLAKRSPYHLSHTSSPVCSSVKRTLERLTFSKSHLVSLSGTPKSLKLTLGFCIVLHTYSYLLILPPP